ncbi:unannotated protein [freshwater metagenome]|uniref:Unannotated protein n=1 Tax=freshwater metagenome TaxID=449393 RepID=A0A6J7JPH7_9ZZZZ
MRLVVIDLGLLFKIFGRPKEHACQRTLQRVVLGRTSPPDDQLMLCTSDCDIEQAKFISLCLDFVAPLPFGLIKIVIDPGDTGCGIDVTNAFVFIDRY